jgi:baseplate J-like protein
MGTNVPAVTFGATGFIVPPAPSILAGVEADISAAFGATLNFNLNTPQGQLASSEAAIIFNAYSLFAYYTQQVDPAYASGRMQDAIGRIYFLERDPAEPTALQIACVGAQGVVIPVASLITDTAGNLYACTQAGTIPSGGTITLAFACTVPGPVAAPSSNGVSIYQAIPGWDSVTVVSGEIGSNVESRQAFEQRRQDTVAGNSFGAIGSIIGAVAKVSGVLDYYGYNNNTAGSVTVGGVSIPAYSIYVAVSGGAPSDVAQAIFSKKGPGAPMTGNTTVTVYDNNPLYASPIPYQITYEIPTALQFLFKVVLVNGPNVPSDAATQVQNALIAAFTQGVVPNNPQVVPGLRARIGSVVYATTYVQAINALGPWAQVASIGIGSANSPDALVVGHISGNTLTVTAVTSGTLEVGQALSDALGRIANGTIITAFGSGSGGTGTYTVNQPQTVAGATFTGSGSGTNLTVSAVTGVIGIGDVLSGTGVPGGTTIVSQTSGTPGGAGVYVTSGATTSLGASLASNAPIIAASADQSVVSTQINQEPQLTASNIAVTTT